MGALLKREDLRKVSGCGLGEITRRGRSGDLGVNCGGPTEGVWDLGIFPGFEGPGEGPLRSNGGSSRGTPCCIFIRGGVGPGCGPNRLLGFRNGK